jgi:hypothetical protein
MMEKRRFTGKTISYARTMIENAFLQRQAQAKLRLEESLVAETLDRRRIPYGFYTEKMIHRRRLPLGRTSLVVGDMPCIYGAMKQLGIPIPVANTYPKSLASFMHRRVWESTVGELVHKLREGRSSNIFAKPAGRQKVFTGQIFATPSDLYWLHNISHRQPIYCSEPVDWLSEYRVYVCRDRILSVDPYQGAAGIRPDIAVVEAAIKALADAGEAYAGYAIDFGVLKSGETALVEMNDGFAVGAYAIGSKDYTEMIVARWEELLLQAEPQK